MHVDDHRRRRRSRRRRRHRRRKRRRTLLYHFTVLYMYGDFTFPSRTDFMSRSCVGIKVGKRIIAPG